MLLGLYFVKLEKYVHFARLWRPQLKVWRRMLDVGLPAGGEFALMFVYMGVIYWVISDSGRPRRPDSDRLADHAVDLHARDGHCVRGRPDRGPELRRGGARACARRSTKLVMLNAVVMVAVTVFLQ